MERVTAFVKTVNLCFSELTTVLLPVCNAGNNKIMNVTELEAICQDILPLVVVGKGITLRTFSL